MDNSFYEKLILLPISLILGLALAGLIFIILIKLASLSYTTFIVSNFFENSDFRLKLALKRNINDRKIFLNTYVRMTGTIFVFFIMFQFSLIKIFSEKDSTLIEFPNQIARDPSSECTKDNSIRRMSDVVKVFIRPDFIKKEKACIEPLLVNEEIHYPNLKSSWPNIFYLQMSDLINNDFPVMTNKTIRKPASTEPETIIDVEKYKADDPNNGTITFSNFLYKISFYSLIALSFILAILKYWYENSYARYRHFNDQFVTYSLDFNKLSKSNTVEKQAYAERIFQLLKEEYLIFYRCNFVYNSHQEIKWHYFLEYKFYQTNLLYALGTNEYLDEWYKSMKNFIKNGSDGKTCDGELDYYLYCIYQKRKQADTLDQDSFLKFLDYSKNI